MKPSRNCGAMAIAAALFTVLANSNGAAVASGPATATPEHQPLVQPAATPARQSQQLALGGYQHLVVIYEENHSFDNLFGGWGSVGGQRVNGIDSEASSATSTQVAQDGKPLACLPQNDVNLTSPPLDSACGAVTLANGASVASHFSNAPFSINDHIAAEDPTCPPGNVSAPNGVSKQSGTGLPGGCTRDIVHRFYNEQFQLDGGKMDRYSLGSDAAGLTQGHYDTSALPVYQYLHGQGAPNYVIADNFFQGAFGGSFLNHQFLISARAPTWSHWTPAAGQAHSVLDRNRMPASTPLYANPTGKDNVLTQACHRRTTIRGVACGNFAVNTVQPLSQPYAPGTAPEKRLPAIDDAAYPNIGDELSAKNVPWNWYSGGWDNAAGNVGGRGWTNGTTPDTCSDPDHKATAIYPHCAGNLFQFHHQPFNYFANYAEGAPGRSHLQDEQNFLDDARSGTLPAVSFVKPYGAENEHPGYASTENGESHLVDLLKVIGSGPDAASTLVVVTYDEFGGQWDHVAPPGQGEHAARGPSDQFGPGTRVPALIIGGAFSRSGVDHQSHDTASVLATIEHAYRLRPLGARDRTVKDLTNALSVGGNGSPQSEPDD